MNQRTPVASHNLLATNGMVDLSTAALLPDADVRYWCTPRTYVAYEPDATCPRWLAFLDRTFDGDADRIEELRKAVGYSLTASNKLQCMFVCHGEGHGKSTFMAVLTYLIGEYATQLFKAFWQPGGEFEPPEHAWTEIQGRRWAWIELSQKKPKRRINASWVKKLTGGDLIQGRHLYSSERFDVEPGCTFWITTRDGPKTYGLDAGLDRRLRRFPFEQSLSRSEMDPDLRRALVEEEGEGIFAWAVSAARDWIAS